MTGTGWQDWAAEMTGHTMGCDLRNAPAEPVLDLGVAISKAIPGTGETIGVTVLLSNTGGADAENVYVTMDPIQYATYVPESSTGNGDPLPDVDGLPAVINGGVLATVASGETITLAFNVKIDANAGGKVLHLAAHAALDEYPTKTAVQDIPIVQLRWPKLSMTHTVNSNPIGTGEVLTATLTLNNTGDGDARGVRVTADPVAYTTYVGGSTKVNGAAEADQGGTSALYADGLYVNVPAGGVTTITWSMKVANNAGGQKLKLAAEAELEGHEDVYAGVEVTVVEAIPAAFEKLFATISATQAAGGFRFVYSGHVLFNGLAGQAQAAWNAGNKKLAIQHLEKIMFYATWRGRFGTTPELFYAGGPVNWADQINTAAQKVRDLIKAS